MPMFNICGRSRLWAGVSVFALGLVSAGIASAQTTPTPTPNTPTTTAPADATAGTQPPGSDATTATGSDVVVVTARRRAMQTATERKRNADTVVDSIVADEAGKLPDASVTEVLQRVAGVSIVRFGSLGDPDHFSAEGSGVQVRGLSGVAGFLNGRQVFSANGGQGLSWGDVTPELMSAVDVYKDSTADRLIGGTGGAIDLRTKMPFDYRNPALQASLGATWGDLAHRTAPEGSLLLTHRWNTSHGEFGALIDLAYNKYSAHDNFVRVEPFYMTQVQGQTRYIPGGFDYGYDDFNRERTGVYAAFQWRPSTTLQLYTILFSSKYKANNTQAGEFVVSQTLTVDPAGNNVFDRNGILVSSNALTTYDPATGTLSGAPYAVGGNVGRSNTDHTTSDWSTGFIWTPSARFNLRGAVQFVDSQSHTNNYDIFPDVNFPGTFGLDLSGRLPAITVPASANTVFADPANYFIGADMTHLESNHGTMGAANIDADFVLSDTGFFRDIQFGARYSSRVERDDISGYNWSPVCQTWMSPPCDPTARTFASGNAADFTSAGFSNFFRGKVSVPQNLLTVSNALVARFDPAYIRQQYGTGSGSNQVTLTPSNFSRGNDRTAEAYVEARFASDTSWFGSPYTGNVGVRFVRVEHQSRGFYTQTGSAAPFYVNGVATSLAEAATPVSGGRTTTRALPSFNISFAPTRQVKVRFAANETMDLPSFTATMATGSLGTNLNTTDPNRPVLNYYTTSAGNPNLKPTFSDNLDLSIEYYRSNSLNAHFALFHKSLKNLMLYGSSLVPTQITTTAGTQTVQAVSTNIYNATEKATINGFEAGIRQFFDQLPSPWNGLGYEATYTRINSRNPGDIAYGIGNVQLANGTNTQPITANPITGLSRDNINATLMYEHGPWSSRLAYNWRSRYLMSTNANGTNGTYTFYDYSGPTPVGTLMKIGLPVYSDDYGQVDFGVDYRVNDHIQLSLQASNLTDSKPKTLQGGYPGNELLPRSWFIADRRAEFTVRLSY